MSRRTKRAILALGATVALCGWTDDVRAQERTTVATAGPQYDRGSFVDFLAGSGWRELWAMPIQVPVLDLDTFAGGLTPEREGGRTSRTLHFVGADGRSYIFRSADKFLHEEALPPDLRHTPAGDVVQDQNSTMFPMAGLAMAPIYEAMGLLHPTSNYVVLPDDPRLGEFRDMAGMLGQIEENPDEGPDETPGFAGSRRVVGNDRMLERLDESPENRLASAEYLAARLIQFMVGDSDRGGDQWRYAGLPAEGGLMFRPVARDHDWAFSRPGGVFGTVARAGYPKLPKFDETFDPLATNVFMTREMDRRFLVDLPRASWDSVVDVMQRRLTDDVFRAAIGRLPPEYQPVASPVLMSGLQARRSALPDIAAQFYRMVAREPNVFATDEDEIAEVERLADGSVEVRLYAGSAVPAAVANAPAASTAGALDGDAPELYFQRRFLIDETSEIRLYMQGGDDHVRVTGNVPRTIPVRVIGGRGDDVLVDSARIATGGVHTTFYTAQGDDRVVRGQATRVDDRDFLEWLPGRPLDEQGLRVVDEDEEDAAADEGDADEDGIDTGQDVEDKLGGTAYRDWGTTSSTGAALDFRSRSGLLIGVGRTYTRYGFRREPYRYQLRGNALYAVDTGGFGIELLGDYHPENTNLGLSLRADATQYESFRFFGYGNDTDDDAVSPRATRDQVTVRPAVYWQHGGTHFGIGPIFRWGDPKFDAGSPLDVVDPIGSSSYAQAGGLAELSVERGVLLGSDPRGFSFDASASAYPSLLDVTTPFGSVDAHARAFVPLPGRPFAALRAGGQWVWGDAFPVHEAAFIGGRTTLRGYTTDRFAGDAAIYGSTELHVPLFTMELLVRGRLGVFGLADAGRVYFDGESPGGWHTSYGGGLWFTSLNRTLSLSYAQGEMGRLYLRLGMPL